MPAVLDQEQTSSPTVLDSGDYLSFNSNLQRVREVSDEPPRAHFMLVPSCMLPCRECYICIKPKTN